MKSVLLALERSKNALPPGNTDHDLVGWCRVLREKQICGDAFVAIRCGVADFFHPPVAAESSTDSTFDLQVSVIEGVTGWRQALNTASLTGFACAGPVMQT